jgi:hypothetical protein
MTKNEETFETCYNHLERNGSIMIFPEGISINERKIRKIKTGTARIALGAEAANNFELGVRIICVGLNYSSHHRFRSDLFVNIDEPINVSDYQVLYERDPVKAILDLTDEIRLRLEKQTVVIENAESDKLVSQIETIYKSQLLYDLGYSIKVREQDFLVTKAISEVVHYFYVNDSKRVDAIQRAIEQYFLLLDRIALNDRLLKKFRERYSVKYWTINLLYLLAGFPLYVFGIVTNYLPFKIPEWVSRKIVSSREYRGSITMLSGIITFTIFYLAQLWLIQYFFQNAVITLAYFIVLPTSGLFAYYYWKRFANFTGHFKIATLFYRKSTLISSILSMRLQIIDELEKGRYEYQEKSKLH